MRPVGLATHFVPSERLREVVKGIEAGAEGIAPEKEEGRKILEGMLKKVSSRTSQSIRIWMHGCGHIFPAGLPCSTSWKT